MSQRVLNKTQFKMVLSSDDDTYAVDAYHPGFGGGKVPVGSLYWNRDDQKITNVLVQGPSKQDPEGGYRRQGIARRMLDHANTNDYPPVHAPMNERTKLGKKWVKGVGGS